MKKFWYVSRDPSTVGYHDPKTAYFTLKEAKEFAESMCKKTGHDFYVMESVELVKQSKPPIEWVKVPQIGETVKHQNKTWTYLGNKNDRWYDGSTDRYRDSKGRFVRDII